MTDDEFKAARRKRAELADPAKVDRLPPHSVEAEQGVLGCILLSPEECLTDCIAQLKGGSLAFYDLRHREIYGTLLGMHDAGRAVDLITVQQVLRDRQQLDGVGGVAYLASLPDATPSAANLGYYIDIVRAKFALRRLIGTCTEIVARAYEHEGEVDKLLAQCEADITSLGEAQQSGEKEEEHIKEIIKRNLTTLEETHYSRGKMQLYGLPTGPPGNYLDKMIGGIRPDYMMLLAGRPKTGKTAFALNMVQYLSRDYVWWEPTGEWHEQTAEQIAAKARPEPKMRQMRGIPVMVFSIEMSADSLGMRLIFGRAGVDQAQYMQGFQHVDDDGKLAGAAGQLAGAQIYVDDAVGQTDSQIAAKARRAVKKHGIKLFVLDYGQLVFTDNDRDDEKARVAKMSKRICKLKKQLKVPWVVVLQMNRAIETSAVERKPILSDLKGCDDPAADCDVAVFSYRTPRTEVEKRPGSSKTNPEGSGPSDKEIIDGLATKYEWAWSMRPTRVDLIVVANRNGPGGDAQMLFWRNLTQFEDKHQAYMRLGVEGPKQGERKQEGLDV